MRIQCFLNERHGADRIIKCSAEMLKTDGVISDQGKRSGGVGFVSGAWEKAEDPLHRSQARVMQALTEFHNDVAVLVTCLLGLKQWEYFC